MEARRILVPQLTVRKIPDDIVRALRIRAARNGRSAEAEHRLILAEALRTPAKDFWARADALRRQIRKPQTDSGELQREMRDER
jgi:plasmid stability protein